MKISIVTTLYNSAPYLDEFYSRMSDSVKKITNDYEIIFVNDASPDDSLSVVLNYRKKDRRVKLIDLSRNFGQHKAIMTGLEHAKGALVFLIDSDLEEAPELILDFYKSMNEEKDADVIYGIQKKRKGGLFHRLPGVLFYKIFNLLSDYKIPENLTTVRLMKREYIDSLIQHRESEILIGGLWTLTGYKQVPYSIITNHKGDTSYSLTKKVAMFINSITSFSSKPLLYIFYIGLIISIISMGFVIYLFVEKVFYGIPVPGYTSLIVSVWFTGGIIIFSIGLVGIYLSRVFMEVKNRPYTIIKRKYE